MARGAGRHHPAAVSFVKGADQERRLRNDLAQIEIARKDPHHDPRHARAGAVGDLAHQNSIVAQRAAGRQVRRIAWMLHIAAESIEDGAGGGCGKVDLHRIRGVFGDFDLKGFGGEGEALDIGVRPGHRVRPRFQPRQLEAAIGAGQGLERGSRNVDARARQPRL